ncbi:MAG: DUF4345 domain-containing protein [Reichenbachiella sp.]|uniref:DUF4345 domain-containing protein n=1 Tax=Reichenbachiella sp. TaxID=2184521 RepID=UPI003267618C
MEIFKIVTLSLSGLMLFFVGAMRLSNPIKTYAKNSGIQLENDVNLLNEMRGVGAVMLCSGLIILLGTVVPVLTFTSFIVATLIFIGFAIGRILSMVSDGKPNKQLSQGLVFELVFGALNIACLLSTMV